MAHGLPADTGKTMPTAPARVITGRRHSVADAFGAELPSLQRLPDEEVDPALVSRTRIDVRKETP